MENQIQNTDFILPGNLGTVSFGNGQSGEIKSIFRRQDGSVVIMIAPKGNDYQHTQDTLKPHE